LPADHEEPAEPSSMAAQRTVRISEPVARAIRDLAQRENVTPFMILMSVLAITLHKWTAQKDMVIGTVVAGRTQRELEKLIGCFMNFLPVRAKVRGAETGREFLAEVRTAVLEGQTHQECPFEKIVEA